MRCGLVLSRQTWQPWEDRQPEGESITRTNILLIRELDERWGRAIQAERGEKPDTFPFPEEEVTL